MIKTTTDNPHSEAPVALPGGPVNEVDEIDGSSAYGKYAPTALQKILIALSISTVLGRGALRWRMSSLIERIKPGPLDVERFGAKMRLYHARHYSDKKILLHSAGYDRVELQEISRFKRDNFRFVDIGANAGLYSQSLALDDKRENQIEVPVRPLVKLLEEAEFEHIDGMKIDVEGFEDRILFPFFESAPKSLWPRILIMEYCHQRRWQQDCLELCNRIGYREQHRDKLNVALILSD